MKIFVLTWKLNDSTVSLLPMLARLVKHLSLDANLICIRLNIQIV